MWRSRYVGDQPQIHKNERLPITCTVCRKVVGHFPADVLGRRKPLFTVCEKCQTAKDTPHVPRDPIGR